MHIADVQLLLGITSNEVRSLCKSGNIEAVKRENSIHYDIPSAQFRSHANWEVFLKNVEYRKEMNIKLSELILKNLS
jgi:hypothetical protein